MTNNNIKGKFVFKEEAFNIYEDRIINLKNNQTLRFNDVIDWCLSQAIYSVNKKSDRFIFITKKRVPFLLGPPGHFRFYLPVPEDLLLKEKLYKFFNKILGAENIDLKDFYNSWTYHINHVWVPKKSKYWKWWGFRNERNPIFLAVFLLFISICLIILVYIAL